MVKLTINTPRKRRGIINGIKQELSYKLESLIKDNILFRCPQDDTFKKTIVTGEGPTTETNRINYTPKFEIDNCVGYL